MAYSLSITGMGLNLLDKAFKRFYLPQNLLLKYCLTVCQAQVSRPLARPGHRLDGMKPMEGLMIVGLCEAQGFALDAEIVP